MPAENGSVTLSVAAASTALPPAASTDRPACVASASTEVTAPPVPRAVGCFAGGVSCGAAPAGAATATTMPPARQTAA